MTLDLTPDQLLSTTRTVRKRLDLSRPVERELLEECFDLALQAPTGGNQQGWGWVVVTDPAIKAQIAAWYLEGWDAAYGRRREEILAAPPGSGPMSRASFLAAEHLAAHGGDPVHFHYDVRFMLIAPESAAPVLSEESHDLRWFTPGELAALPLDESLSRMVRKWQSIVARRAH